LRQFFCRQYFRDFQEWFGEMESTDGACSARWSSIVCLAIFRIMVKKVANMFAKNDFPQKRTSKEYPTENYPYLPHFAPFLPNFITFYISQHYGRHVTTSSLRHQSIKVTPRNWEGGRRRSDDVSFFQI